MGRDHARRTSASERLRDLLGMTDEEVLGVLGTSPLEMLGGHDDEREDVRVLLALLEEAEANVGAATLRRWVRPSGALELLARGDFPAFEDALADLQRRGFVLRSR